MWKANSEKQIKQSAGHMAHLVHVTMRYRFKENCQRTLLNQHGLIQTTVHFRDSLGKSALFGQVWNLPWTFIWIKQVNSGLLEKVGLGSLASRLSSGCCEWMWCGAQCILGSKQTKSSLWIRRSRCTKKCWKLSCGRHEVVRRCTWWLLSSLRITVVCG